MHLSPGRIAQDGQRVDSGVCVVRGHRYGPLPAERLDVMTPTAEGGTRRGRLVYVHGGGWVAVNRELLMQSVTPFVRSGFTVYAIE